MEIRGMTISHSSYVKMITDQKEKELTESINKLENDEHTLTNYDELEGKSKNWKILEK